MKFIELWAEIGGRCDLRVRAEHIESYESYFTDTGAKLWGNDCTLIRMVSGHEFIVRGRPEAIDALIGHREAL